MRYFLFLLIVVPIALTAMTSVTSAQGGLRQALEDLDKDDDGEIEPEEITPLARPFLERIARTKRMSLYRDNSIEEFQEAARIYYAVKNGATQRDIRIDDDPYIKSFEPADDQELVPGFGPGDLKYAYTQDDVDRADRILRYYDRDDDGAIDRYEGKRTDWTGQDPFSSDVDRDGRLTRMELIQRYARRRLLEKNNWELIKRAGRVGNGIKPAERRQRYRDDGQWWIKGGNDYWLTASLMGRFDENRDGQLSGSEIEKLNLPVARLDTNTDNVLTREELFEYVQQMQRASGNTSGNIPSWFYESDTNADNQISMSEYTQEWTDEKLATFNAMDANGDGLLTVSEVDSSQATAGGRFRNTSAEVLPPGRTIISEIEVEEDFIVGDIDVQIQITHSNVGFLDAYLLGPDGDRGE
ncbi:MAG: calcium sensor EFh [Planctomycetota bacterium]